MLIMHWERFEECFLHGIIQSLQQYHFPHCSDEDRYADLRAAAGGD